MSRWLIVGLGNPGKQYEETRHNVGFMAIHRLALRAGIQGKSESRFKAIVGTGRLGRVSVVLVEPLTFMNLSGEAVGKLVQYYQVEPDHILVLYDEAALPFGRIRVRPGGSAGGHNGIKSIIQCLGGEQQFPRIRVGIGAPAGQKALHAHVLSKFTPEERAELDKILEVTCRSVETVLGEGIEPAMSHFNGLEILDG